MKPVLQALLLAERIFVDKDTNQFIIAGTFNHFNFKKRNSSPDPNAEGKVRVLGERSSGTPFAYINLTDLKGPTSLTLRYVNLKDDTIIMETTFAVHCTDPLQTKELAVPLPRFPAIEGVHSLELTCLGHPLGSIRITAKDITDSENSEKSS